MFRGWRQTFPTYYFLCCFIAVTVAQMLFLAGSKALRAERNPAGGAELPVKE
jgi:cbb3-type cytochrome oxidase subunit 3